MNCTEDWIQNTKLYRHSQELKHEITLHKWYESERAGYDIGWHRASVNWLIRHGTTEHTSSHSSTEHPHH